MASNSRYEVSLCKYMLYHSASRRTRRSNNRYLHISTVELLAITRLRTHAIITAMGTLLYPRPIPKMPVSVTCHPRGLG
jgi:hypothetical protein